MNTLTQSLLTLSLAGGLGLGLPENARAGDLQNAGQESKQKQVLGYDLYEGKTNWIARVSRVTPTHVWVIYADGTSGRNIPRSELESPLRELYPYDPAKAADYARQNLDKNKAVQDQQDQQRGAAYARLLRQEKEIQSKLDAKNAAVLAVQKEIKAWRAKPRQPGKAVALNGLIDKKTALDKEVAALAKQLEAVRAAQAQSR